MKSTKMCSSSSTVIHILSPPKAVAILLAAGSSTRMGHAKPMLPWKNQSTLLSYQLSSFLAIGISPVVVLGQHNADLQHRHGLPEPIQFISNPDPSRGKVSSILCGLSHLPKHWDAVFISGVDQPRSPVIYQALYDAFVDYRAPITLPSYQNRRGHPTVFSRQLLTELQHISDTTQGLRNVVHRYQASIHYVCMEMPEVLFDLNTPVEYAQARQSHSCD